MCSVLGVSAEAVNADTILGPSPSLDIAGWSVPTLVVLDNGLVDSERRMRESSDLLEVEMFVTMRTLRVRMCRSLSLSQPLARKTVVVVPS